MPFQLLRGVRPARRVLLANSSPEPQFGLLFNQTATNQCFSFPNPALNEACVTLWVRRNQPYQPGSEYWFFGMRPANTPYVAVDSNANGGFYVEGQLKNTSADAFPSGLWNRVVINITSPLLQGTMNIFSGSPALGQGPLNTEIYDLRLYSRRFTPQEIANRISAPNDSLLAQFEMAPGTSGPTVYDQSGNGRNGTLYNF